ncbi:MAG: ABC transporter permease, partial [Chloroflexota bacterium]
SAEGWALANGHVGLASARLWGLPAETRLYRPALRQGRWFRADEPEAVVLSSELADDQGLRVGDAVEIQANGQARRARVVGIAIDNTIFLGGELAGKAFMPRATLSRLIGRERRVYFFALGLASREVGEADRILAQVEKKLARWRPVVQPVYAEIAAAREGSRLLTLALLAMLIIIALAGALGIVNTLTLNVFERRREIAVLRAVGATNRAVLLAFVAEGLALGGLGGLVGGALGFPVGHLFTRQLSRVLFSLDLNLRPGVVALSLAFALALAALGSLGPAIAAAHLPNAAGLRYE